MFLNPWGTIDVKRHRLPHWQQGKVWLFVTFRLADSLPAAKLRQWDVEREHWLTLHPEPWTESEKAEHHRLFHRKLDEWLDAGDGACVLKNPVPRNLVSGAFHHFDGIRYLLDSFVVMPNHVHVLFSPNADCKLADIIHSWKRFSAREINNCLGKEGRLWQPDYWDRLLRSPEHFNWSREYIRRNPARLRPEEYTLYVKSGD